uniref:tRNA pseudouridine synthase A n=1 Tax=Gemmiger formicilis TaxID=745368 RepID=UPI004028C70E
MNYLLWISYKGTRYAGFQVQPNAPTVCAVLQDAMQAVFGCRPDVKGCSRTDAGVHARRFALSFCYTGKVPMQKIVPALNAHLPPDIRALEIWPVAENFHARYAAHAKTYRYYILNARVDDPFTYDTCHRVGAALNLAAMQAAAAQFIGTHDFSALCASGSSAAAHGDTVRTITNCT